jgi:DNA polymerase-1
MIDCIVDANSLFGRAYYATLRQQDHQRTAVQAALISTALLFHPNPERIPERVDRALFCWDGDNHRDKGRPPKEQAYLETRACYRQLVLDLFGCPESEIEGYEADDLVATAAYASDADQCYVVSADKDLMQLDARHIHYYSLCEKTVLSPEFVSSKWGVKRPEQIAVALAIIGDSADNIPGVRGMGLVKCRHLFEHVTASMTMENVVSTIAASLPPILQSEFYESLEQTLLNLQVPGVAKPAPFCLVSPQEVEELGLRDFYRYYLAMYRRMVPTPHNGMDEEDEQEARA